MQAFNAGVVRDVSPDSAKRAGHGLPRMAVLSASIMALALLGGCAGPYAAGNQLADGAEGMECRKFMATGTNVPRQVCRSSEAWARMDRADQRGADEYGRQTRENSATVQPGFSRGQPLDL